MGTLQVGGITSLDTPFAIFVMFEVVFSVKDPSDKVVNAWHYTLLFPYQVPGTFCFITVVGKFVVNSELFFYLKVLYAKSSGKVKGNLCAALGKSHKSIKGNSEKLKLKIGSRNLSKQFY